MASFLCGGGGSGNRNAQHGHFRNLGITTQKLQKKTKNTKLTRENAELAKNFEHSLEGILKEDRATEDSNPPVFDFELAKKGEVERLKGEGDRWKKEFDDLEKIYKKDRNRCEKLDKDFKEQKETNNQLIKENESLRKEKKGYENRINELDLQVKEKDDIITEREKKIKWLEETCKNSEGELTGHKANIANLTQEITSLRDDFGIQKRQMESLEEECKKKEDDIADLQRAKKELIAEKEGLIKEIETFISKEKQLEQEKGELQNHVQEVIEKINRQARIIQDCAKANEILSVDNANLKHHITNLSRSIDEQRKTIDKLQKNLSEEKKAKENALNRLSAAAANRLRDQNPGITDLSDPNRPLKLAEKVSELYDNEWTNAMENLESKMNIREEKGITILLKIIRNVFDACADFGDSHLQSFPDMLILPAPFIHSEEERMVDVKEIPSEMLKPMKDFRKSHAKHAINYLQKFFFTEEGKSKLKIKKKVFKTCEEYINKCIELCWMMRIQDPPIYMETEYPTNSDFDSNKMRSYTKAGKFIHFVVWPTFFLHKDGPLLAKGVVQGSKIEIKAGKETNGDKEDGSSSSDSDGDEYDDARSLTDSQPPGDNPNETTSQDDVKDTHEPNQPENKEMPQEAEAASNNGTNDTTGCPNDPNDFPEEPSNSDERPKPNNTDDKPKELNNSDQNPEEPQNSDENTEN
ncbi:myosin heavy chain, clone 203-like [Saccostrea cucullata]|uniref:myosin heavy chain, clone 203-like n=1 Tax=Saccostrea cuccullata TaxID=36930 RepID=UPI002ED2353C